MKNNDVVEFVTEIDQMFVDSMPDTRKFIRLALPGEVDGKLPVLAMRFIFQNDEGALFKGMIFPPKGKYTVADLNQLMLIIFLPQYPDACIGDKGHPCPT